MMFESPAEAPQPTKQIWPIFEATCTSLIMAPKHEVALFKIMGLGAKSSAKISIETSNISTKIHPDHTQITMLYFPCFNHQATVLNQQMAV